MPDHQPGFSDPISGLPAVLPGTSVPGSCFIPYTENCRYNFLHFFRTTFSNLVKRVF